MTRDAVDWTCRCGEVRLSVIPGDGSRCVCYFTDCRAFYRYLGAGAWLDPAGGVDLWQTVPDRIAIVSGADRLAAMKLTGRGPIRMHTTCCRTPVANLPPRPAFPFAALTVGGIADPSALGPVDATVQTGSATGPVEKRGTTALYVAGVIGRMLKARLTGRRATPFFNDAGRPVATPRRLTEAERAAAYG